MYKKDFPGLIDNPDLIFLDNAGITHKPKIVLDEIQNFYKNKVVNNHSIDSKIGVEVNNKIIETRKIILSMIGANNSKVIFTSGTTESLNNVCNMIKNKLKPNNKVIVFETDHLSSVLPWIVASKEIGFKLEIIKSKNLEPDIDDFKKKMNDSVKVIAVTHSSNVFGNSIDLKAISKLKKDAILIVDAAQTIPHSQIDFDKLDIDFLAFSSGKIYGPSGLGVLVMKQKYLKLNPIKWGGGILTDFHLHNINLYKNESRFEAGTMHLAGIWGLNAALKYFLSIGPDKIGKHEKNLYKYACKKFASLDNVIIYSNKMSKNLVFNVKKINSQDVVSSLGHKNIILRSGKMCANMIVDKVNDTGLIRASFAIYNTKEDVDALFNEVKNGGDFLDGII